MHFGLFHMEQYPQMGIIPFIGLEIVHHAALLGHRDAGGVYAAF